MKKTLILSIFLFIFTKTYATTWDEPWQDEIIKKSEYFILAKVINNEPVTGVKIKIIKQFCGIDLADQITISDFHMLHLCSNSDGHGPEFQFDKDEEYYFLITLDKDGNYCLPTPTSGFAYKSDTIVYATYRHSYHQTLISASIYEKTMTTLFKYYHKLEYETAYISEYAKIYLAKTPAGFEEDEVNTFFAQHVSMECIYHLRLNGFYEQLLNFLHDTSNFHNQISAARALVAYNSKECKNELIAAISNPDYDDFVKVMCIYTLTEFSPKKRKKEIEVLVEEASNDANGFGGNIMDPRVCTYVPTVKEALVNLLKTI